MVSVASMFRQLLRPVPTNRFECLVRRHEADRDKKGFHGLGRFVAMLSC